MYLETAAYSTGLSDGREIADRWLRDGAISNAHREVFKRGDDLDGWHNGLLYSLSDRALARKLGLNPWKRFGVLSAAGKRACRNYDLGCRDGWNARLRGER